MGNMLSYNEHNKERGWQLAFPLTLTEKRNGSQKVLDKRLKTRYNEFIKNGIGAKSNLIHIDRKRNGAQKKFLTLDSS